MKKVISNLAQELLMLQGDGNKDGVTEMLTTRAVVSETLRKDLTAIEKAKIPLDLMFEQGTDVLGLDKK
jgi:transcriptional regulator